MSVRAEAQHAEAPRGLVIGEAATPGQTGARFVRAILLAGLTYLLESRLRGGVDVFEYKMKVSRAHNGYLGKRDGKRPGVVESQRPPHTVQSVMGGAGGHVNDLVHTV